MNFRRCLLVLAFMSFALAAGLPSLTGAQGGPCSPKTPQYCPPPKVQTGPAKQVTTNSATLTGTVNPNGSATTCFFGYGQTRPYGSKTPSRKVGSGSRAVTVTTPVNGLTPRTTYHDQLVCRNLGGHGGGGDRTFRTHAAPTVTTERARHLTSTAVRFRGTVNPNGFPTRCMFRYGRTDAYGSRTPARSVGSGTTTRSLAARVTGLASGTVYHFRLFCTNVAGTGKGRDQRVRLRKRRA